MKDSHPRNKEAFDRRRERLLEPSVIHQIDTLFEMECEMVVSAYYGGRVRAGLRMMWKGVGETLRSRWWAVVYRFGDRVGWTQLRPVPGTPFFERHGGSCDKLNCNDANCIRRDLPRWWRRLTGMEEDL